MNYYSYDDVWKIYEITDRNWQLSPASNDKYGEYDASTNTYKNYVYGSGKNNPYVHTLYRDLTDESGYIREWDSHNADGTNREHVWCQSRGFKAPSGAKGPAGTDVHHLISGDGYVNQSIHNNYPYGFVKVASATGNQAYTANNKRGTALHTFSGKDQCDTVFEPQDSDKGDIARAIFYMAARYNNLSGSDIITQYEPNLTVANYATSNGDKEDSSATHPVAMGILQDLLAWNKMDPVDEYEKYRNDLIYRNFQGNRNPFVDFPEWADCIWGVATKDSYDATPVGKANPLTDSLYDASLSVSKSTVTLKTSDTANISATTADNSDIFWEVVDTSIATVSKDISSSGETVVVTSLNKEGKTTLKVSATVSGTECTKEVTIVVSNDKPEEEKQPLNITLIIIIVAAVLGVAIIVIVIYASASKKSKRKMKSTAKKAVKKATKKKR